MRSSNKVRLYPVTIGVDNVFPAIGIIVIHVGVIVLIPWTTIVIVILTILTIRISTIPSTYVPSCSSAKVHPTPSSYHDYVFICGKRIRTITAQLHQGLAHPSHCTITNLVNWKTRRNPSASSESAFIFFFLCFFGFFSFFLTSVRALVAVIIACGCVIRRRCRHHGCLGLQRPAAVWKPSRHTPPLGVR